MVVIEGLSFLHLIVCPLLQCFGMDIILNYDDDYDDREVEGGEDGEVFEVVRVQRQSRNSELAVSRSALRTIWG